MAQRLFNASNTIRSSKEIFTERARYRNFAVPSKYVGKYPKLYRDFWFIENMFYGRIDLTHRTVIVKDSVLASIDLSGGKSIVVVNFVADALRDFISEHKKAYSTGKINKQTDFLSEILLEKGYDNPLSRYDNHINEQKDIIFNNLLANPTEIITFEDFTSYFIDSFFINEEIKPLTLTAFMNSSKSSPLNTGLFVDIENLRYDLDQQKIDSFYDDSNFKFYSNNCVKHGFLIDKNVPWRLCSSIGSKEMEKYMLKYDVTLDTVFDTYYDKTYKKDMKYILQYVVKFYNQFVSIKPTYRKSYYLNKDISRVSMDRQKESSLGIEDKFTDKYKIDLYIKIRNKETNSRFEQSLLDKITITSFEYLKMEGIESSYDYIDRQFYGFLNDNGGYNSFILSRDLSSVNKITGQSVRDELTRSVEKFRNSIY